jgi:hypothetical protein
VFITISARFDAFYDAFCDAFCGIYPDQWEAYDFPKDDHAKLTSYHLSDHRHAPQPAANAVSAITVAGEVFEKK